MAVKVAIAVTLSEVPHVTESRDFGIKFSKDLLLDVVLYQVKKLFFEKIFFMLSRI